jgi:DNA polymerase III delta subunit
LSYPKKSPYKTYRHGLPTVLKEDFFQKHKLLVLRGEADFLVTETARSLRLIYEAKNWAIERWEGPQVNAEKFLQATAAASLFDPETLTFINQAQGKNDLAAHLATVKQAKDIQNPVCLLWRGGDPPAKFQKELDRLQAFVLACDEPAPWEFRDFVVDRAQHYQMKIAGDAADLLLEAVGSDLFKLDNELNRVSLTLGVAGQVAIVTAEAIRPLLGFLREDHIFKLDQFLCQEAYGRALLLLKDLLDRGEKALGLLAILAMHCRKALQIQAGVRQGLNPAEMARTLRLPPSVIQSYMGYVQRRPPQGFAKALRLCHEADRRLKSRGEGEEIWLNQIVWELRTHARPHKG